jgi:serine/threonine protein kinase
VPFFTMEFVEGERLGTCIHREPAMPLADVKAIAEQMLDGLSAAHAQGILHLDFKGDNVLLRRGAGPIDPVIMDFGLSRACDAQGSVPMSESAHFAGTLPYMSLEQLEGRNDIGPAADVYAFGVVLYEMLTRRLPFEGATLSAVLLKQLKERPDPPSRYRLGLSSAVDAFVLRCLKPDPRARHPDAAASLAALRRIRSWERPIYKRRGAVWFGLTTALTAGVASAGFLVAAGVASDGDATMPRQARSALEPSRSPASAVPLGSHDLGQEPAEGPPVPEPPAVAPPPKTPSAQARTPLLTRKRRPPRPEAKLPPSGPEWTPSAVPTGGFWRPPEP